MYFVENEWHQSGCFLGRENMTYTRGCSAHLLKPWHYRSVTGVVWCVTFYWKRTQQEGSNGNDKRKNRSANSITNRVTSSSAARGSAQKNNVFYTILWENAMEMFLLLWTHWVKSPLALWSLENYFLTFVRTNFFLVLLVIILHIEFKFSSTLFKYLKPIVFLLALQMIVNM
jgi:hypothetical protein